MNGPNKNNKLNKKLAITSFILSIIGGYPWFSIASIIAVIFGHIAIYKIKKNPDIYAGKWLAIVGLILGYLGIILIIALEIMKNIVNNQLGY